MYHYIGSGLQNVWLENGYKIHETPYGEGVSIENTEGLHRAIGDWLIHNSTRLTGAEFRFLRKEQEMSQKNLAGVMGVDEQSVARWEKGRVRVPKIADHFIRGLYSQYCLGNRSIKEMIDRLNSLEAQQRHASVKLKVNHSHWEPHLHVQAA